MIPPTDVDVSGRRFRATYRVDASADDVESVARWMTGEMTVEFPLELLPHDGISRHIVGRVEAIDALGLNRHEVVISVAEDVVAGSMTQLLSVVWGNVSLAPGVDLVWLEVPDNWPVDRGRPRGLAAFRAVTGVQGRPLVMSAIKPLGLPVERLAVLAGELAAGGLDIIKDDQSLADQPFAPFADRIGPVAEAVAMANARNGMRAVYAPSLNGPVTELPARAEAARRVGAAAVMVQPGISGYPAIAAAAQAGLPVMAHPGGFGGLSDRVDRALVHGRLPRLAGADCSIFVIAGGRFDLDPTDAGRITKACLEPAGGLPAIMPTVGGGVTVDRAPSLRAELGDDLCLLIGGDLHRTGDPRRRAAQLRAAVER